jgi:hypothetical protein
MQACECPSFPIDRVRRANLCFAAPLMTHDAARRLVRRIVRLTAEPKGTLPTGDCFLKKTL